MRAVFLGALAVVLLAAWSKVGGAVESTDFYLAQEQMVSGFGSGDSATFVKPRGVVGHSGTGVMTSPNFRLDLENPQEVRPPGGNGIVIDVQGTVDDNTAAVVAKALNTVTAAVSQGSWVAKGIQLAEGPNTITVTATNSAGSSITKVLHVTVDTIPPARPTLKSVVTPTAQTPQTISGTKDANTGIWLNGKEVVPVDLLTTWSFDLFLVQGKNPVDLWAKDRARNASTHVISQIIYDATPPTRPAVTDDGRFTTSTNQLHAGWSSQEDDTEIVKYVFCIGTTSGGTDVVPFTGVGTQTVVTQTGLTLTERTKYYFTVKATNTVGLVSAPGFSDGIRVNTKPPTITSVTPADGGKFYPPLLVPCSMTATDPSGDPLEYRFLLNGLVLRDWSPSNTFSLNTGTLNSGLKTLRMEVQDPFDGEDSRTALIYLFRKPLEAKG